MGGALLGAAKENLHPLQRQRAVLGSQRGNFSSFELLHSWCVLILCFYSHNSVNLVIGISSMSLNEGSKQISSQIVAKSL